MSWRKKILDKLKATRKYVTTYDSFGIPITVNYKGEDTYKTFFGALCSIIVLILMLSFVYQGFTKMLNRTDPDYV